MTKNRTKKKEEHKPEQVKKVETPETEEETPVIEETPPPQGGELLTIDQLRKTMEEGKISDAVLAGTMAVAGRQKDYEAELEKKEQGKELTPFMSQGAFEDNKAKFMSRVPGRKRK